MSSGTLVERFVEYLGSERNFSAHTVRSYTADIVQFSQFLLGDGGDPAKADSKSAKSDTGSSGEAVDPAAILNDPRLEGLLLGLTPTEVRSYLAAMRNEEYSKSTIARKLATLRSFYKYLVQVGRLEASPVTVVRTPRQDKRLPKCLDVKQIECAAGGPEHQDAAGGTRPGDTGDDLLRRPAYQRTGLAGYGGPGGVLRGRANSRQGQEGTPRPNRLQGHGGHHPLRRHARQKVRGFAGAGRLFVNKSGKRLSQRSIRRSLDKYLLIAGHTACTSARTCCGTVSPRTCSTPGPTCGASRKCSATRASPPRRYTRT